MRAARLTNASAQLRCKGESPLLILVVKQRPGRTSGAGIWARERTGPVEGFYLRSRHCLGGFRRLPRRSRVARLPWVPPSGLDLRGREP